MKYLIDTHILLWFIQGNKRCSNKIISLIENKDNIIFVSIVSFWEIAIKLSLNKLDIAISVSELTKFLNNHDFNKLNIEDSHLETLLDLPFHHRDPFDRMLISQAIASDLSIISDDSKFTGYAVDVIGN